MSEKKLAKKINLAYLHKIFSKYEGQDGALIPLLQDAQNHYGYLPAQVIEEISNFTRIPLSKVYGVITFYAQFYLKPRGKNIITACCGTACHVKGSAPIISRVREDLKIPLGETTSSDGKFTVESVACVGACSIAPVFIGNKKVFGKMTMEKASEMLKEIDKVKGV